MVLSRLTELKGIVNELKTKKTMPTAGENPTSTCDSTLSEAPGAYTKTLEGNAYEHDV